MCGIFICNCVCVCGPGVLWVLRLCMLVVVVVQGPGWIAWTLKPCMCLQNRLDSPHSPFPTPKSPTWFLGGKEPSAYSTLFSDVWGAEKIFYQNALTYCTQASMTLSINRFIHKNNFKLIIFNLVLRPEAFLRSNFCA